MAKADEASGAASVTARLRSPHAARFSVVPALVLLLATALPVAAQDVGPTGPSGPSGPSGPAAPSGPQTGGAEAAPGTAAPGAPGAPGAAVPARGPEWTIQPGVSADEQITDNVRFAAKGRQSDFVSSLSPNIFINGDTPRLAATLSYAPTVIEHVTASDQNSVAQNLVGQGKATFVPNLFFMDFQAASAQESRVGGFGLNNQAQLPTNQATQTTALAASPYLQFHYGDIGDAELRYRLSQTLFSGNTGAIAGPIAGTNLGQLSDSTQQEGTYTFTTGEAFAHLRLVGTVDYVAFSSTGSTSSTQSSDQVNAQYNFSGPFTLLSSLGYERLNYTQANAFGYSDASWSLGGQYQPRDDRMISLTYGRSQGQNGFTGIVNYALTPLTQININYSHEISTGQQQITQALGGFGTSLPGGINPTTGLPVTVGTPGGIAGGGAINPITGLPSTLTNPNLALQNSTISVHQLTGSVNYRPSERNFYALVLNRTEDVSDTVGAVSQTSTSGQVSYNRDMSPNTTGVASIAYADTTSTAIGVNTNSHVGILTLTAGLNYAISDTLSAAASYSLSRQKGGPSGAVLLDILGVIISKRF